MSLFATWRGILDLPALPERILKIGGNRVFQLVFGGARTRAEISPSEFKGHDIIVTKLDPPYREILLRHKGARRIETILPVVVALGADDPSALPKEFEINGIRLETWRLMPIRRKRS